MVAQVSGVGGVSQQSTTQSIVNVSVSSIWGPSQVFELEAFVLPKITCDLPLRPVSLDANWHHLSGVKLADPDFGTPGCIDLLIGADLFSSVVLNGRRQGPRGTPSAFETAFGWVLSGNVDGGHSTPHVVTLHATTVSGDDLLRKFWEVEELHCNHGVMSLEERSVVDHFNRTHSRDPEGRFIVPLPKKPNAAPLGESRSLATRRFLSLERSLRARNQFEDLRDVVEEYSQLGHAEPVPFSDLGKPPEKVFYLPVHAVVKESSSTTRVRAVFNASAKSATGVSLNDQLIVGPTVHAPLIDVLLRFRTFRVALTADVSKMYRAVVLPREDRDLHRFVWRSDPEQKLRDYRMTRVTFGVASSSFAANMSLKQNAMECAKTYPLAARAAQESFYVDDGLVGADSVPEAVQLQNQLQKLFSKAGFTLCKWRSSESSALLHLDPDLLDKSSSQHLPEEDEFTKALGIEWNSVRDCFRLTVSQFPVHDTLTKRTLVSDIARTYDVLGWFAPSVILVKVLLQQVWEARIGWDEAVPPAIAESWQRWRQELPMLSNKLIPRCYYPKNVASFSVQLHGFSDASEVAYAAVAYLRVVDLYNRVSVSLIMSKTKVAPIKRLSIPRLELCSSHLLTNLLHRIRGVLNIPLSSVFAWTYSTVVLQWLAGNPRRFKTFVGNRVSAIVDLIPPDCWHHVKGSENPADSASRGLLPSQLLEHKLWWQGPSWLHEPQFDLPKCDDSEVPETGEEICLISVADVPVSALPILDKYSNFNRLKQVTAWVSRFVHNCRCRVRQTAPMQGCLTVGELRAAEWCWLSVAQKSFFGEEVALLSKGHSLPKGSPLLPLHSFVDTHGLLHVGGRGEQSDLPLSTRHPIVLPGKHPVVSLIVRREHHRLLHAGPTLLAASLGRTYHITGSRKLLRSVVRSCTVCRRVC